MNWSILEDHPINTARSSKTSMAVAFSVKSAWSAWSASLTVLELGKWNKDLWVFDLGKLENGKFNFMCGSHSSISGSSCFGMLLPTFSVYFSSHQTLGTVVIAILVVSFVVL